MQAPQAASHGLLGQIRHPQVAGDLHQQLEVEPDRLLGALGSVPGGKRTIMKTF